MLSSSWIALLPIIPPELHDNLAVTTSGGVEINIQNLVRTEECRCRPAQSDGTMTEKGSSVASTLSVQARQECRFWVSVQAVHHELHRKRQVENG